MSDPQLSAVLVVGSQRARAQRVLDALGAQTAAASIEVIVVDLAPKSIPRLESECLRLAYLSRPDIVRWGTARKAGVSHASSPIVAFIEDHCFPARDWAELVIEAHQGPWAAVGYAFTNANPESYVSRSSLLARYGRFVHPTRREPAHLVSGNNVSYKRKVLLDLEPALETLLTIDFNLQELLAKRGVPMFIEARALAAHENFTSVISECTTGHFYCRLLAARRAETQSWSTVRRVVYGLGAPLGSPAIRLGRLLRGLGGRRVLWPVVVAGLPVIIVAYLADAIGESLGYLLGAGASEREVLRWELEMDRTGHS